MYGGKVAGDEIEAKRIHSGEEINEEKGAVEQGKAGHKRLSAETISENGAYQESLEKKAKWGRNSFATLFKEKKKSQEFEMAKGAFETELYADPFDMAEETISENIDSVNHTSRSEAFKYGNQEIPDSSSKSAQNLMDDEDFVAAVEDVHTWLGQILRQEQY